MPDAQAILGLWERTDREHPIDRVLSILVAFTAQDRNSLAELPIHRLDALLLASRVAAFGSTLEGVAKCPACACTVEASLSIPDFPAVSAADGGDLEVDGTYVTYRVPNSRDLAELIRAGDAANAEKTLLQRCQLGGPANQASARAIDAEIEKACDASSLELRMSCPQCQHEFVVPVDVGGFFWEEIASYAAHLLDDVDALASRYGWSEAQILALPDRRRRRYLEMYL